MGFQQGGQGISDMCDRTQPGLITIFPEVGTRPAESYYFLIGCDVIILYIYSIYLYYSRFSLLVVVDIMGVT